MESRHKMEQNIRKTDVNDVKLRIFRINGSDICCRFITTNRKLAVFNIKHQV